MEPTSQRTNIYTIGFGKRTDGTPGIAFMMSPACFIETADDPVPGVMFTPAQAREVAYALLLYAEQMASGLVPLPARPSEAGG